jgi:hypothetical protein
MNHNAVRAHADPLEASAHWTDLGFEYVGIWDKERIHYLFHFRLR